jgi:hypothetical protein
MADDSPSLENLRAAQRTARQIYADGTQWLVYELRPLPFDRRSYPSLVFESDSTIRRVRRFPANWRELPDEELFALSWSH